MKRKSIIGAFIVFGLLLQTSAVAAKSSGKTLNFEKAWQEAAESRAYSFACTVSASSIKTQKAQLSEDRQSLVDFAVKALKRYKVVTKGTLLDSAKRLSTSQVKLNTLGILDLMAAGQLTFDQAIAEMGAITKKKMEMALDGDAVYYKVGADWKTFENADISKEMYEGASDAPFTASLEKASFALKKSKAKTAVYEGTLNADSTVELLIPFMGEEEAKKQPFSPVKLFVVKGDHLQKYQVAQKVALGSLSFTVKENCNLKLNNPKVKIPSGAEEVSSEEGLQGIAESL